MKYHVIFRLRDELKRAVWGAILHDPLMLGRQSPRSKDHLDSSDCPFLRRFLHPARTKDVAKQSHDDEYAFIPSKEPWHDLGRYAETFLTVWMVIGTDFVMFHLNSRPSGGAYSMPMTYLSESQDQCVGTIRLLPTRFAASLPVLLSIARDVMENRKPINIFLQQFGIEYKSDSDFHVSLPHNFCQALDAAEELCGAPPIDVSAVPVTNCRWAQTATGYLNFPKETLLSSSGQWLPPGLKQSAKSKFRKEKEVLSDGSSTR